MTQFESAAKTTAWDEETARDWAERDRMRSTNRLTIPWTIAAATSSIDNVVTRVLDVASGPGGFLGTVLDYLPDATGVWFDFSDAMKQAAMGNLERLGDRVQYQIGDMTILETVGAAASFDLVTSSRATHHLLISDLAKFYTSAFNRLRSGGWIANIDSLATNSGWDSRLRLVRTVIEGAKVRSESSHPHPNPFPSFGDHLAALRVAGFDEPQIVWSSISSGLLMAQKP